MEVSLNTLLRTGRLGELRRGMTQEEVRAMLGEPDAVGGGSRKYPYPSIFLYGTVELNFDLRRPHGLIRFWWEAGEKGAFRLSSACEIVDWAFTPDWTFVQVEDYLNELDLPRGYLDAPSPEDTASPFIVHASGIQISFTKGKLYGIWGWEEVRTTAAAIDQELERDRRRLLEADNLIAAGDRHFHADTPTFEEAQSLYREALLLRLAALGEQHESVAVAMNRLANVYYQQQNQEAAGTLFERALAIRAIVLPPDAPDLRLSVNNLANVYRNQGRFSEAEPLYRRSLRMREQEAGHADHPAIWRNLVRVLEGQGKLAEAAEYLQRIQLFEAAQSG